MKKPPSDTEIIAAEVARLRLLVLDLREQVQELSRLLALSKDERLVPRPPAYVPRAFGQAVSS